RSHLLHRTWPPYGKWLARSAARLPGGGALRLALADVLRARHWRARQSALADAAELLAAVQRAQGLPAPDPATEGFFDRPHVGLRDLPEQLLALVQDEQVAALPTGAGAAWWAAEGPRDSSLSAGAAAGEHHLQRRDDQCTEDAQQLLLLRRRGPQRKHQHELVGGADHRVLPQRLGDHGGLIQDHLAEHRLVTADLPAMVLTQDPRIPRALAR